MNLYPQKDHLIKTYRRDLFLQPRNDPAPPQLNLTLMLDEAVDFHLAQLLYPVHQKLLRCDHVSLLYWSSMHSSLLPGTFHHKCWSDRSSAILLRLE